MRPHQDSWLGRQYVGKIHSLLGTTDFHAHITTKVHEVATNSIKDEGTRGTAMARDRGTVREVNLFPLGVR